MSSSRIPAHRAASRRSAACAGGVRGVTLVEVLITVAVVALLSGAAILGMGATSGARMKRGAVMIASAIRVAYAHANATSKPVRLVFDFEERQVILEEGSEQLFIDRKDKTGGAAAATELEKAAQEEAEAILKGPRAPRPSFQPSKAFGFDPEDGKPGKDLPTGIRFASVETAHADEAEISGRAYLYFWPGGMTERAAVMLTRGDGEGDVDGDFMTVLVAPLTGKAKLMAGRHAMARPRTDDEESERSDQEY
jgi:general secretion pathway protein H